MTLRRKKEQNFQIMLKPIIHYEEGIFYQEK